MVTPVSTTGVPVRVASVKRRWTIMVGEGTTNLKPFSMSSRES